MHRLLLRYQQHVLHSKMMIMANVRYVNMNNENIKNYCNGLKSPFLQNIIIIRHCSQVWLYNYYTKCIYGKIKKTMAINNNSYKTFSCCTVTSTTGYCKKTPVTTDTCQTISLIMFKLTISCSIFMHKNTNKVNNRRYECWHWKLGLHNFVTIQWMHD